MKSKQELVLFSSISQFEKKLFFKEIYLELIKDLPVEKLEKDQVELLSLVYQELKKFGGDQLKQEDMVRAQERVLKLINLGLEYALGQSRTEEGSYDKNKARAILAQKSLVTAYTIGQRVFGSNQENAKQLLSEGTVKLGKFCYSLVDKEEREVLEVLTDLDKFSGSWSEISKALALVPEITLKLKVKSLFPITEIQAKQYFEHLGSCDSRVFPSPIGLIRFFLNSLLVVGMFRKEEEFYTLASSKEATKFVKEALKLREGWALKEVDQLIPRFRNFRELDIQWEQEFFTSKDKEKKYSQLISVLVVTLSELKEFVEGYYLEPYQFKKKVPVIKEKFLWYFKVASKALKIGVEQKVLCDATNLIEKIGNSLLQDIHQFCKPFFVEKGSAFDEKSLASFWQERLLLNLERGLSLQKEREFKASRELSISALLRLPPSKLVDYLFSFSVWPEEKQKTFATRFNPNVLAKGRSPELLLRFFYYLFPAAPGWDSKIVIQKRDNITSDSSQAQAVIVYQNRFQEVVRQMVGKINWAYVHPYFISELWFLGSDLLRDLLYEKRQDFKVTLSALRDYYLADHNDFRLLEYALRQLGNEDRLSPIVWEDLFRRVQYLPQRLKSFLEIVKTDFGKKKI